MLGVEQDITERKKAEDSIQQLLKSVQREKDRLITLINNIPDEVWCFGADGNVELVNLPVVREFGSGLINLKDAERLNDNSEVYQPDGKPRQAADSPPLRALKGETVVGQEEVVRVPSRGDLRTRQVNASPLKDIEGNVVGAVAIVRDITERKKAEEALRESKELQAFLLNLSDVLRHMVDPVEIQETASRILGEQLQANRVAYFEVIGKDYVVTQDYAQGVPNLRGGFPIASFGPRLLAAYQTGTSVSDRDVQNDPQLSTEERDSFAAIQIGSYIGVPLIKNGEFVAGLAVHNIEPRAWTSEEIRLAEETVERTWAAVERARAERALRESEERFRVAQELSPDGFLIFRPMRDSNGVVTDFLWIYENEAAARMNDTNAKKVCGKRVSEVLPHHDQSPFGRAYKEVAETGEVRVVEEAFYDQDTFRQRRWFRAVVVPTTGGDVAILVQDVTERKRAEKSIHHHNEVLKAINRILSEALTADTEEELGRKCLVVVEQVTQSKFGFIGEVNSEGRLDALAISDPGWEACRLGHRL